MTTCHQNLTLTISLTHSLVLLQIKLGVGWGGGAVQIHKNPHGVEELDSFLLPILCPKLNWEPLWLDFPF